MSKNFNEMSDEATSSYKPKTSSNSNKKNEGFDTNMNAFIAKQVLNSVPLKVKIILLAVIGTSIYGTVDLVIKLVNLFL